MPNPSELARLDAEREEAEGEDYDVAYERSIRERFPWLPEMTIQHMLKSRHYSLAYGKTLGRSYTDTKKNF